MSSIVSSRPPEINAGTTTIWLLMSTAWSSIPGCESLFWTYGPCLAAWDPGYEQTVAVGPLCQPPQVASCRAKTARKSAMNGHMKIPQHTAQLNSSERLNGPIELYGEGHSAELHGEGHSSELHGEKALSRVTNDAIITGF